MIASYTPSGIERLALSHSSQRVINLRHWRCCSPRRSVHKEQFIQETACQATRRQLLAAGGFLLSDVSRQMQADALEFNIEAPNIAADVDSLYGDFLQPGPYTPVRLPKLEHYASSCFPACIGNQCLLRVTALYPKPVISTSAKHPFPLAIISGGFLVPAAKYLSYAEHLASWGFVVLLYDKVEAPTLEMKFLTDVVSVSFVRDLIDWSATHAVLKQLVDVNEGVYLVGHSRGGKVSVLAAAEDSRVTSLCLLDPVDNTKYAPLGVGYPSAVEALRDLSTKAPPQRRPLPILVVGAALSADCAPKDANYAVFFEASTAATWQVLIPEGGHFQFLDEQSMLDRSVCSTGRTTDATVRAISQATMVSWAKVTSPAQQELSQSRRNEILDRVSDQLQSLLQPNANLSNQRKHFDIF